MQFLQHTGYQLAAQRNDRTARMLSNPTRSWTAKVVLIACGLLLGSQNVLAQDENPIDVTTVLRNHCAQCHAGEESEGGFSLNTRELVLDAGVVEPGSPEDSILIERITTEDLDERMPPKEHPGLNENEIAVLREWIRAEIPWPNDLGFESSRYEPPLRPRHVEIPPGDENANPIDRIVDAYFAKHNLESPSQLSDAAFARKASFDITGLPPTQADLSLLDREALIDALLSRDQQYAEHWMTFWSDLLRNAYSGTGYIDDGRRQITGWLYASLLNNKAYDKFVRELIAPPDESSAGFTRGIKWRGNVNASQTREVQFAQNVSQVFLGINLKCASCHDSFIDHWSLDSAYGLAAVYSNQPLEIFRCDTATGEVASPNWLFPELGQVDANATQPERLKQLAELMTHPENGRLTRTIVNRIWKQLMGRGIVHPVDAMHNRPWDEDVLDYLANYLVEHEYDLKQLIRLIATSRIYQANAVIVESEAENLEYVFEGPVVKRLTVEQMLDAIWTTTDTFPAPDGRAFKQDGRRQGGQLAAVLDAHQGVDEWGTRRVRAVFTPQSLFQANLGRPHREQVVTSRPETVSTLEALDLVNGPAMVTLLHQGATQLQARFDSDTDLISHVFVTMLSREPSEGELELGMELLTDGERSIGIEDLLWSIVLLPEFQFIR